MPALVAAEAAGRLPLVGHALQMYRRPLEFLRTLHAYGDVVRLRLGPVPVYVITAPALVHRFLVLEAGNVEKGRIFDTLRPVLGDSVVLTEGEEHARRRRQVRPAFDRERMPRYVDLIREQTEAHISDWRRGHVAADDEMAELASVIGVRALFSAADLDHDALAVARSSLATVAKDLPRRTLSPRVVAKWPLIGTRRFDTANARLRGFIRDVIRSYRQNGTKHDDLLSILLAAPDAGEPMSDGQLTDELVAFMIGANETMSATLAWTLHELGQNPQVDRRLHAELADVLDGRTIRYDDIANLEYTRRVIQEVLRRYPVWLMMYRTRSPLDLGVFELPAGADVVISPYALHHDPRRYADPLRFDPDRWLPDRVKGLPRGAFMPFGSGRHRCAGEGLAWNEIATILGTVLARWRLAPEPGHTVRTVASGSVHPDKLPMILTPRSG